MFESVRKFFKSLTEKIEAFWYRVSETQLKELADLIAKWKFESRPLEDYEIDEAKKVFGQTLKYAEILIFEGNELPNFVDDIGNIIKRMPKRKEYIKNAITLGNWCIFGRTLTTENPSDMSWMIHELTHAWQYQTMGWKYLSKAINAQIKLGAAVYDFGGEDGLKSHSKKGDGFRKFNMEQQGDITKQYYLQLVGGRDTSAWDPYIQEIRGAP